MSYLQMTFGTSQKVVYFYSFQLSLIYKARQGPPICCTNFVLNSMQNIMFHVALSGANSKDLQTFAVLRTKPTLVFHSLYGYPAASSAIMLTGLLVTLIMLQGRWILGRSVTLSPLETAKAFYAPIMEHTGHSITADGVLGKVGQMWVKYVDGEMVVQTVREEGHIHNDEA